MKVTLLSPIFLLSLYTIHGSEQNSALSNQIVSDENKDISMHNETVSNDNNTVVETFKAIGAIDDVEEFDINNCSGPSNNTYLMHAATYQHSEKMVTLLLKYGAHINQSNQNTGWTPLHHACNYTKNPKVIETLIEHGASVNIRNKTGHDPLLLAIGMNSDYAVENTEAFLKAVQKRKELRLNNNNNVNNMNK